MNEELLNQLLQNFQDLVSNIDDIINTSVQKIDSINNVIKSISDTDIPDLQSLNTSDLNEPLNNLISNIRNILSFVKSSSESLGENFNTIAQLLNTLTEVASSGTNLKNALSKLIQTTQQLSNMNVEIENNSPETESNNGNLEPPNYGEEVTNEMYYNQYLEPQSNISTTALPYQDIANALRNSLVRPIEHLEQVIKDVGLSFETITGGLNRKSVEELQSQTLPSTLQAMINAFERFSNKLFEKSSAIDRAINIAYAQERIRNYRGLFPEDTYVTIAESLGRAQFEELKAGVQLFTSTLSNIIQDLRYVSNVPVIGELPYNVGSPEFYRGFLGLPTYAKVPAGQMGILLQDLQESVTSSLSIFARQLFPEQAFERESIQMLKGFGFSFFTSEFYQEIIETLKKELPDKYKSLEPFIQQTAQVKSIEELNQTLTMLRENVSMFGLKDLSSADISYVSDVFGNINFDKIKEFLNSISEFGNLSNETKVAISKVTEFLENLKRFITTGETPEGGLNAEAFIENVRKLSDDLEVQVNKYFKEIFPQYIQSLSGVRNDLNKLPIEPEHLSSFIAMTESLNNIVQNLRQVEGRLTFGERVSLFLRENLERPFSEMMHMNLVNLQWALMLGLSTSIMDVMTRPAYETVYSTITPIYESVGNLTGILPLFKAFQEFPYQIEQMTSMLQTSLNSISALLGSRFFAEEAVRTATEISRVQPIQLPEAIEVLTAISTYPSTRPYASDKEFQNQIFNVVQLLSLLAPEQGIQGALFAIREALGGQWRSLQMRFNISPEVIAQYAGVTEEKMKSATGAELIKYLYTGLSNMFGGERVLLQKGAQLDVQINNIIDTLISSLVLPLVSQQNETIQNIIEKWFGVRREGSRIEYDFENSIIREFMPQQYAMIMRLAEKESERTGEPKEEVALRLAKETWGTPIGAISGMVAIINNALSDVIGALNISDTITELIIDFQNKFTTRVEAFKDSLSNLDFFDRGYTEKRKQLAEQFIRGLINDLSESIRTVTGADLGIVDVFMGVIRDAIMGVASQTTSFILKESVVTALNLPGDLFRTFTGSIASGILGIKETNITDISQMISELGKGVSGLLTWVYMWKTSEAFTPQRIDWKLASAGMFSALSAMSASNLLSQRDILSNILGLGMLGLALFTNRENASPRMLFGASALVGASQIIDIYRHQTTGLTKYILSGIESLFSFIPLLLLSPGSLAVRFGLGALSAIAGIGIQLFQDNITEKKTIKETFSNFLEEKRSTLSDTERATIQQLQITWTTLGGPEFYRTLETQLDNLAKVISRVQQGQNIYAIGATSVFENVLLKTGIMPSERIKEELPKFYSAFANVYSKFYDQVRVLGPGEKPGEGLPTIIDISKSLREEFERIIGKSISSLPEDKRTIITDLISTLSNSMLEQLKAIQVLKTGIAEALQQIQPQIAWKQVQDFIYQKPVKLEPIRDVSDIQRYVQQVQRALEDMVDTFKRIPSEFNKLFGYMSRGQISYQTFTTISDTLYKKLLEVAKSEKGREILASPHFYPTIMEMVTWDKISMIRDKNLQQQIFETFFKQTNKGTTFLDDITRRYWEHKFKLMEPGFQILSTAHPITNINITDILNRKLNELSSGLSQSGQELLNALRNLSQSISQVTQSITHQFEIDNKQIPTYNSVVEKSKETISEDKGIFGWVNSFFTGVKTTFLNMWHTIISPPGVNIPQPNIKEIPKPNITETSVNQANITIIANSAEMKGVSQVNISS